MCCENCIKLAPNKYLEAIVVQTGQQKTVNGLVTIVISTDALRNNGWYMRTAKLQPLVRLWSEPRYIFKSSYKMALIEESAF